MKPNDVAQRFKISGSTVRAWSKEFAEFLSASAAGGDGERRDFGLHDLQVVGRIKQMTDQSMKREDIIDELRRLRDGDWRELPPLEEMITNSEASEAGRALVPRSLIEVERVAWSREVKSLQEQITELKGELSTERDNHRADMERLLRELAAAQIAQREAEIIAKLHEQGRLKPPSES